MGRCNRVLILSLLALPVILLAGCLPGTGSSPGVSSAPESISAEVESSPTVASGNKEQETGSQAEEMLRQMTLREKVGQLFIIRPDALDFTLSQETIDDPNTPGVTAVSDEMKSAIREYPAGGLVLFGKNLVSPQQITAFNKELQKCSGAPLFLCVDEEGGAVARLANHPAFDLPQYESAAAVGKSGDPEDARRMGSTIGAYLYDYGFNVDFAPDADVNTNPDNPVIGTRAFSSDAQTAAALARGMADGLRQQGILPVFKHFPGHGDTLEDSHAGIAVTHKTREQLETCEFLPFEQASRQEAIMVGHIAVPELTGDLTPATMSERMVTEVLKNQLGFEGLIVTDSLSMGAITDAYSPADAALTALAAGCDLLLMPNDYRQAFDAVLAAAEDGILLESQLDDIVLRILQCKEDLGLL